MAHFKDISNGLEDNPNYIMKGPSTGYVPESNGIGYAFYHRMLLNKHLTAQVDGISGVKDTYENLLDRCVQAAKRMKNLGIKSKDVISICSANHLNSCVPMIAAYFIGAIPACLDPVFSLSDTVHLLKQTTPKVIFVGDEATGLIEEALFQSGLDIRIVVFGISDKYMEFSSFLVDNGDDFAPIEVKNNREDAIILFSSGTTGMPKGIALSHRGLLGGSNIFVYHGLSHKLTLVFSSYYWISSTLILVCSIMTGGARLIFPRFDPSSFWKLLQRFQVSLTFIAPSQAIAMYKHNCPNRLDNPFFADLLIGGGPMSDQYVRKIREMFPKTNCSIAYGQTECSGVVVSFNRNDPKEMALMNLKPGSSGFIGPDFVCKVVDVETREILGPNKKGELCFKSDYLMNGYRPAKSDDAWDSEGWLKSGDVGYYDEDGCFFVVDRIKEMLKYQSFHIPPSAIEAVILTHPEVAHAVVIGLSHEDDGDHPLAVVSLKRKDNITEEDIIKYVEERMHDRYKLRGGVKFMDNIPSTASGKPRRNHLKLLVAQGQI